ncbi:LysR substrate-binding domain-containing protein [Komagataeibacter sp. FXV3]|uniref:LysR substrate-binding domain-containing protein n=1 Tax=Komagataeibacter sp. FXV3 TaxID=2608998 RepID=UPI00187B3A3E|nr:LysR substrate-binding domain-containing protein [Komagataeibacter sp. FXV3]
MFEKKGRNVRLTRAGQDFAHAVAVSLGQLEIATRSAHIIEASTAPQALTVSLPPSLGMAWLNSTIIQFSESHNIPDLTIKSAMVLSDVDWETCDIAVVYDRPPFLGKNWHILSNVRLIPVCSPIFFPNLDLQKRHTTLTGITLLHEDDGHEWSRWAVTAGMSLMGSQRVCVASAAHAIASAVQGRGIALASDVLTRNYLAEGALIHPFPKSINASHDYYIICPEKRSEEPLIRSLVEHIVSCMRPIRMTS